jgi:hypothetical protein
MQLKTALVLREWKLARGSDRPVARWERDGWEAGAGEMLTGVGMGRIE